MDEKADRRFLQHANSLPMALANDQTAAARAKPVPAHLLLPHVNEKPSDWPGIGRPDEFPQMLQEPATIATAPTRYDFPRAGEEAFCD